MDVTAILVFLKLMLLTLTKAIVAYIVGVILLLLAVDLIARRVFKIYFEVKATTEQPTKTDLTRNKNYN